MKRSLEELKNDITNLDITDDKKIEILENIVDSFPNAEDEQNNELEEYKRKFEDLQKKYIERFKKSSVEKPTVTDSIIEEKKFVDIKNI